MVWACCWRRWTRARTTPLASAAPSSAAVTGVAAHPNTSWYARSTAPAHRVARWSPAGPRRCAAWLPSPLPKLQSEGYTASAAAAATSPDPAGHGGSSRTCHVRSNHRTHHPVRQAALGWTTPRPRHPAQADRWTWLVLAGYTQLRLARPVAGDQRLPWERPRPQPRRSPYRVRRGFRAVLAAVGSPARAPNPHGRSPGHPKGSLRGPHPAIQPSKPPLDQPTIQQGQTVSFKAKLRE
jgi:hypothetical protein